MARIVPKLNLNKTPDLVDNNSLIFAKNIRLNANGISSDYGFTSLPIKEGSDISFVQLANKRIVGVIPYNTEFYLLVDDPTDRSYIYKYDENTELLTRCNCNWNWSGGKIDGVCTINLNGDILLTIAEYDCDTQVPIKTINLTDSDVSDDETIYTQTPKVPFINLDYIGTYQNVIPAGTYQFFIRYEIRKDFYTNWFPASKELFAGTKKSVRTHQGGLTYIDKSSDSNFSFKFSVHRLITTGNFKSFQLGFILAHDDQIYARAYKHYSLDTDTIYFDYDTESIREISVDDLLEFTYSLYNVGNVTSFRNKLYISNYTENNPNPDFRGFASSISIRFKETTNERNITFNGRNITVVTNAQKDYMTNIQLNALDEAIGIDNPSIKDLVRMLLNDKKQLISDESQISYDTSSKLGLNLYVYKHSGIIDVDEQGGPTPVESPTVNIYTLSYGVYAENTYTSDNIDDIIDAIVNIVYAINIDSGKIVDSAYNEPLQFSIIHYTEDTDPDTPADFIKTSVNLGFFIHTADIEKLNIVINESTLVPHQGYNFYLHLVKNNGEVTNGYLINGEPLIVPEPSDMLPDNEFPAIYPVFNFSQQLPSEYVACFITIAHVKNTVTHIFDIETVTGGTMGHCLELDTSIYPWLKDINFVSGENSSSFDYRASYDNESLITFGGAGECIFHDELDVSYGFAKMPYDANEDDVVLIQCTPFILVPNSLEYDNYRSLNLPGYLCRVQKPSRSKGLRYYFAGSDIYIKGNVSQNGSNFSLPLTLAPGDTDIWKNISSSTEYTIYSNFNLNYLALHDVLQPVIVTKDNTSYILEVKQSSQLSEVYELPSMYKSYTRKIYVPYSTYNTLITFNNTIRSSKLEGDEAKINMFRFTTTDYYNVPTDKGVIVNLVAVGDNILVHTQDSIYKFSGQNSLTAAGGEDVQMKESEPFDTGIQELFGSEFGYAGLANKEHQVLSEFGYTFWDKDSGRIYLYTGNAQIKVLSDDISKLLRRAAITNIHLADDYYNNRIFICIEFNDNKIVTLSYDFVIKSFISVHDFSFNWHFKTKTKCYFIYDNHDVYRVGTKQGTYGPFINENDIYPRHGIEDCIVDVIYNDRFEIIKTLNVLQWVCNKITGFDTQFNMAEETFSVASYENRYKGNALQIYSDSCMTDKLDINSRSNDERLRSPDTPFDFKPNPNSYTQVRYNLGKWTFNYFRNILSRKERPMNPRTLAQDDTLIYGKYFVARFIFNRNINFKFEDVSFFTSSENNA